MSDDLQPGEEWVGEWIDVSTGLRGDMHAWWTGPCGALHVETNPTVVGGCPDGLCEDDDQ